MDVKRSYMRSFKALPLTLCMPKKTAFLGPNRATFGNRGHDTACQAAKRPPIGKPKVSRVTSGYGGLMIQLSQVRLSQRNGGFIGAA